MRVSESMFYTARFARDAELAEEKLIFFSAERAEKKMIYALVICKSHGRAIKNIYFHKIVMLL
jgi:hypothetical protein